MGAIKEYYHDEIERDIKKVKRSNFFKFLKGIGYFILIDIISFLILSILFSSCSAQWHLQKALEKEPGIIKSTKIVLNEVNRRDTLILLNKTIVLAMPRDTVKVDTVVFQDKKLSFIPIVKKQGIVTINISMTEGRLKAFATVDSAMIYNLRDSLKLKNAIIEKQTTIITDNTITVNEHQTLLQRIRLAKQTVVGLFFLFILFSIIRFFTKRR